MIFIGDGDGLLGMIILCGWGLVSGGCLGLLFVYVAFCACRQPFCSDNTRFCSGALVLCGYLGLLCAYVTVLFG